MKQEFSETRGPRDQPGPPLYRNLFAYEVFESFDHTGGRKLEDYRQSRLDKNVSASELIMDGEKMNRIAESVAELKKLEFPRSQLHTLARPIERNRGSVETVLERLLSRRPKLKEPIDQLASLVGRGTLWFHLDQLWDYLPATNEESL